MTTHTKQPCIFGCQRLASGKSEMCTTCRNGLRYWDDKDHADILKREEQLEVLSARMHVIAATRARKRRVQYARRGAGARHEARV